MIFKKIVKYIENDSSQIRNDFMIIYLSGQNRQQT